MQVASPTHFQGGEKKRENWAESEGSVKPSLLSLSLLFVSPFCHFSNLTSEPAPRGTSQDPPLVGTLA